MVDVLEGGTLDWDDIVQQWKLRQKKSASNFELL